MLYKLFHCANGTGLYYDTKVPLYETLMLSLLRYTTVKYGR